MAQRFSQTLQSRLDLAEIPVSRFRNTPGQPTGTPDSPKKDFIDAAGLSVGITTLMLTIPSAVLACRDLSQRAANKPKAAHLIEAGWFFGVRAVVGIKNNFGKRRLKIRVVFIP